MFKRILKILGLLLYFFMAQVVGSVGMVIYKTVTDPEWSRKILEISYSGDYLSEDLIMALSAIILPALLIADILIVLPLVIRGTVKKEIFDFSRTRLKNFALLPGVIGVGIILNLIISYFVEMIPQSSSSFYDSITSMAMGDDFAMAMLITGILSPISEELIFRYSIIGVIGRNHKWQAVLFSGLIFGIAHLNLIQGTYAALLGFLFGYVYVVTGDIIPSIVMHIAINASSVWFEFNWDYTGAEEVRMYFYMIIALALISALSLYVYLRILRRDGEQISTLAQPAGGEPEQIPTIRDILEGDRSQTSDASSAARGEADAVQGAPADGSLSEASAVNKDAEDESGSRN